MAVALNSSHWDASDSDINALSSPRSFRERVNGVLGAPLPACLQMSRSRPDAETPRERGAVSPRAYESLLRLLQPSDRQLLRGRQPLPHRHTDGGDECATLVPDGEAGAPPIYERLLEEGRRAAERREQLVLRAIGKEECELRAAPSLPPHYHPKRIPPPGQRIEDRLLERAKQHEAEMEARRKQRMKEQEELLRNQMTGKPTISVHAKEVAARYSQPQANREEWRARRREEIARAQKAKAEAEAAEVRAAPCINPRSEKLAARRRHRERSDHLRQPDAVLVQEQLEKLRRWSESLDREAADHTPRINAGWSSRDRRGDVSERLYAEAAAMTRRRAERGGAETEGYDTPSFRPTITSLASATTPRYHLERGWPRLDDGEELPSRMPLIDPVSDAIASRLPQSSRERLSSLSARHCTRTEQFSCSGTARRECDEGERGAAPHSAPQVRSLPLHVEESLQFYERRRQDRLDALRAQRQAEENEPCTFAPRINDSGTAEGHEERPTLAVRSQQWLHTKEQRLHMLREQQQKEEEEELKRCADWRLQSGFFERESANEGEGVYGEGGVPWGTRTHVSRQRTARQLREERDEAVERRVTPLRSKPAQHSQPSRSPAEPPLTVGSIYENVYRSRWYSE